MVDNTKDKAKTYNILNKNEVTDIVRGLIPDITSMELNGVFQAYYECTLILYLDFESVLKEIYKSYKNNVVNSKSEYLGLALMYLLYKNSSYKKIVDIIYGIIVNDKLYKNNGAKRIPWLETKYDIINKYSTNHELEENEIRLIFLGIKLGLNFPGIIGNPLNEYKLKKNCNIDQIKKIIISQYETPHGGINEKYMISQMKGGGLSIDLGYGCPLGCIYCYRVKDTSEQYINKWMPKFIISPEESVNRLVNHPWFTPHVTPVGLHMSTTEPFFPSIWPSTYKILSILDDLKLTNRITIITKYFLEDEQLTMLNAFKYIDIDICVCYSNMPKEIEPSTNSKRLEFLQRIKKYKNIYSIGYLRPLIEGHNTSNEILENNLIDFINTGVSCIVYGGVALSDTHKEVFQMKSIKLEESNEKEGHKYLSEKTNDIIKKIFNDLKEKRHVNCNLYMHSSCARVSVRDGYIPDYNCHNIISPNDCIGCQRKEICNKNYKISSDEIEAVLERTLERDTSYMVEKGTLYLEHEINRYQKIFIRHTLFLHTETMDQKVGKVI